jgi:LmbE family N-acetylglucosaminyl deacetylase
MQHLSFPEGPVKIVCIAAHPDDVEIAAGGTLLTLAERGAVEGHWLTLTGSTERHAEAEAAVRHFCLVRNRAFTPSRTDGCPRIGMKSRTFSMPSRLP